jgi:hypothetical protein
MELLKEGFVNQYARVAATKSSARDIRIGRLYLDGTVRRSTKAIDDAFGGEPFQSHPVGEKSLSRSG